MRFSLAASLLFAVSLQAQTTLIEKGRAALDRNDPQAAIAILETAVAQSPRDAEAHYVLGLAYGAQAQRASVFRRASLARHTRDEFERAVRLDPNDLDARSALAEYYRRAPAWLGGSDEKAHEQEREIRARAKETRGSR